MTQVSAIVPTFNRAALVCRAVDSILAQSHADIEVVVVDDGSTDDTAVQLARYGERIRVLRQANAGVCAARNAGIRASSGEFVAFLDSDDQWAPWKIGAQLAAFQRFPELVLTWTDAAGASATGELKYPRCLRRFYRASYAYLPESDLFDVDVPLTDVAPGAPEGRFRAGDFSSAVYLGNFFHLSTVMLRRPVLDRAGLFDPAVGNAGEDYEMFSRVVQHGRAGLLDVPAATCTTGERDRLSAMRSHTALANWDTMRKIERMHPDGLRLPPAVMRRRRRAAAAWAGEALFDDDRFTEARPFLGTSLGYGNTSPRSLAYLAMSFMPRPVVDAARRLKHASH